MLEYVIWFFLIDWVASSPIRLTYRNNGNHARRLVVFGDSLSDDGHGSWVYSNGTWPADPAYYGHHFSNGPVWAQLLAKTQALELHDHAIGGATADNSVVQGYTGPGSTIPVPAARTQITNYLAVYKPQKTDIYTIWIGANDAFFSTNVTGWETAGLIAEQVQLLYQEGARHFLLPSYPGLNAMPFAQTQSTAYQAFLSQYTEDLRAGLYAIAKQYHSKANIEVVDIYTQFRQVIANPEDYNLDPAVIATACLKGAYGESERSLCDDPDSHLWFDAYHPSRIGHRIVASVFQDVLKEWA